MTHENEDLYPLAREGARNRWTLAALIPAFLGAATAVAVASGGGQTEGLLGFAVVASGFLMLLAFVVRVVIWRFSSGSHLIDDLPTWFMRLAVALVIGWLAIAVIIVVTP